MSYRLHHTAIAASAGSGKTYTLAHRFIGLLGAGFEPEKIVALTFSRKAAGEIFDSVVNYLCRAAASEGAAARTAKESGLTEGDSRFFLGILRRLLAGLHRLNVGTLDSFAIRVAKAFAFELGLEAGVDILDNSGAQARTVQREVYAILFGARVLPEDAVAVFLEAFRQATYGHEEKRLVTLLDEYIARYHDLYLSFPDSGSWGETETIWTRPAPWMQTGADIKPVCEELAELTGALLEGKALARWQQFIAAVKDFDPAVPLERDLTFLLEKLFEVKEELGVGAAEIKADRKKQTITQRQGSLALKLIFSVMAAEFTLAQEKTKGIYKIVSLYEALYDRLIRRRGQLTFNDVQRVLSPGNTYGNGVVLSAREGDNRLFIDYRLDARLDHWLLDEFQDTSDLQWQVLANLIDEVVQDGSGKRSLFYVGDVKQAIYSWRGGNTDLFGRLLQQYRGMIREKPLDRSYRSCRAVIGTVNKIFSNLPEGVMPSRAVEHWRKIWRLHETADGIVPPKGYAVLLEPQTIHGEKPGAEDRYEVAASLLRDIAPQQRSLSTAILVRTNNQGRAIVDYLRRHVPDIPVVHEGESPLRDNPVVNLLLALVQYIAHPGDTLAQYHLKMSPLDGVMHDDGLGYDDLPQRCLGSIMSFGFAGLMEEWGNRLEQAVQLDDFGKTRLAELVRAASEFDAQGKKDCNEFLYYIDQYTLKDITGAVGIVRVMTIHQAKGLGFDLIILPDMQSGSIVSARKESMGMFPPDENRSLPGLLSMPRKDIAVWDSVLAERLAENDAAACFDELCVLYVALTRAKQGLYMITSFPGKSSRAFTAASLLKLQLTGEMNPECSRRILLGEKDFDCLFEEGVREWYVDRLQSGQSLPAAEDTATAAQTIPVKVKQLGRVTPSAAGDKNRNASLLFSSENRLSLDFGSAIHSLFEEVTWLEETDTEHLAADWLHKNRELNETLCRDVIHQFKTAAGSSEVRAALKKPAQRCILWREKQFEAVLNERWVTGVFDRVVIAHDDEGKPVEAVILDYKSNRVETEEEIRTAAEEYRSQLELYKAALSVLIKLPPEKIHCRLIFTGPGRVYHL